MSFVLIARPLVMGLNSVELQLPSGGSQDRSGLIRVECGGERILTPRMSDGGKGIIPTPFALHAPAAGYPGYPVAERFCGVNTV
ncbi:MAG: hypothetical protein ACLQVJ_20890 [Syntrophobacteraceae bacterium]